MPFSGLDPLMDLECVAWSAPLRRFVPALGCELVAQPGAGKEARDTYGEASHTSRFYIGVFSESSACSASAYCRPEHTTPLQGRQWPIVQQGNLEVVCEAWLQPEQHFRRAHGTQGSTMSPQTVLVTDLYPVIPGRFPSARLVDRLKLEISSNHITSCCTH